MKKKIELDHLDAFLEDETRDYVKNYMRIHNLKKQEDVSVDYDFTKELEAL